MTHQGGRRLAGLAAGLIGLAGLGGCTTEDLAVFSATLSDEMAANAYASNGYGYGSNYNSGYGYGYSGPYWSPNTFGSYGGWPSSYAYGDFVGYNECRYTGSLYTCDTNGDGLADMYGDASDGSYASSALRVNGRGEAFTWGEDGWERNRAYDGPRQPDEVIVYDGD